MVSIAFSMNEPLSAKVRYPKLMEPKRSSRIQLLSDRKSTSPKTRMLATPVGTSDELSKIASSAGSTATSALTGGYALLMGPVNRAATV